MKILPIIVVMITSCSQSSFIDSQSRIANVDKVEVAGSNTSPKANNSKVSDNVKPGLGIRRLQIGDDFNSAVAVLGKPYFDQTYQFAGCSERMVQWQIKASGNDSQNLKAVFSPVGEIVQIQAEGRGLETPEGIENEISLLDFKSKYKNTSAIELYADTALKSNSKYVEGYSAYFVDKERGIAFEFYKNRKDKTWKIGSTFVFKPSQDFVRWQYCDSSDKTRWKRFYTLDLDNVPELQDNRND